MTIYAPVIVPAVLAGVCLLMSWRLWRRKSLAPKGHWGGAAGVALGYFAGHVVLASWPGFPPPKAVDWLAYLVLVAGVAGVLQGKWGDRWYLMWPVRLAICGLVVGLCARSYIQHTWTLTEAIARVAGSTIVAIVLWDYLERYALKRSGASLPLSLWVWCAGSSAALVFAGSALLGQLAGALSAVLGAAVVLAWWAPGLTLAGGALTVLVPAYMGLLVQAYLYAELPLLCALLLMATPFSLALANARQIYYMTPWKAAIIRALIVGVPVAVAAGLAWYWVAANAPEEYYY